MTLPPIRRLKNLRQSLLFLLVCLGMQSLTHAAEKHALLIGIDDYQNNIRSLSAASADVSSLADTLQSVGQFKPKNVRVLSSQRALKPTRAQILHELGLLAREVKPDDTVLILYSGHGVELNRQSYLVPSDANPANAKTLEASCLNVRAFQQKLKTLPVQGVILAFDMCRTAPFGDNSRALATKRTNSDKLSSGLSRDLVLVPSNSGPRAAITLFSCSVGEKSWEWRAKKHGYFSYCLEQGLRGGAADENGTIKMGALMAYLEETVPLAVQVTEHQTQTPWSELHGNGGASLVLATVDVTKTLPHSTNNFNDANSDSAIAFREATDKLSQALNLYSQVTGQVNLPDLKGQFTQMPHAVRCDGETLVLSRTYVPQNSAPPFTIENAIPLRDISLKQLTIKAPNSHTQYFNVLISMIGDEKLISHSKFMGADSNSGNPQPPVFRQIISCSSQDGAQEVVKKIRSLVLLSRLFS